MLLTRAPVAIKSIARSMLPLDLHVLSLSLAFILSQDQTLHCYIIFLVLFFFLASEKFVCPDYQRLIYLYVLESFLTEIFLFTLYFYNTY